MFAIMDSFAAPSARMILAKTLLNRITGGAQRNDAQVAAGKGKCIPVRAKGQGNRLYGKKDNEEKKKTDKQGTQQQRLV